MFNLNFHDFNIQAITQFFQAHPYYSSIFTYLISFIEAMAVIGVIIPGAITMPAIGFLIGTAIIPASTTFMWAILGAITGDILSYFLGVYFQDRIHRLWPFTRWPNLLVRSEKFFRNHGGKSVFIGRFVGPTRAMIPMIAGMLKLPFSRFLLAAVPSAALWAIGYMIPGILLGALSLELPAKVATKFTIYAFLAIMALWLIIWLIQHFFKQIWQIIDYYILQLWRLLQKSKKTFWVTNFLSDPKERDNHQQLTLVIIAAFTAMLFFWSVWQILSPGIFIELGHSFYHLLSSLRFEKLDHFWVLITFFGDAPLLLMAGILIFLWLIWKRYWYIAGHCLAILIFGIALALFWKVCLYSPRPGEILYAAHFSSFPSAHALLSISFYGFLAVVIARELKNAKRYFTYLIFGTLTFLIVFSRLYLGAHWLNDVLGSIFLGLTLLLVVTVSYHRRHILNFKVREFVGVVIGVFILVWFAYASIEFKKQMQEYALKWQRSTIALDNLIKPSEQAATKLPLYRLNRLGRPIEAFNVVYIGELTEISRVLLAAGWEAQPTKFNFQNMIKMFSTTSIVNHLTIFPQLYHNKKVALLFTKDTKQNGEILILRLWLSDIDLKDSNLPLWIGTVEYHRAQGNIFSLKRHKKPTVFIGATEYLTKYIKPKDFALWKKHYLLKQQPPAMQDLHWDGKLLIIKPKRNHNA